MASSTKKSAKVDNIDEAEQSRQALAQAQASLKEARALLAAAEADEVSYRARLSRGDVSALDDQSLVGASTRIGDLSRLVQGAQRKVSAARRALVTDNPALGWATAPAVEAILGVSVSVATAKPTTAEGMALPHCVIVQRHPNAEDTVTGRLRGRVVLHYVRTMLHSPVSQNLGDPLRDAGSAVIREPLVSLADYELGAGIVVDRVEFPELAAFQPDNLPLISETHGKATWQVNGCAHGGPRVMTDPRRSSVKVVRDVVTDGIRVRDVAVAITARYLNAEYHPDPAVAARDAIRTHLDELVGSCLDGMGQVTHVEVLSTKPGPTPMFAHSVPGWTVRARITYKCRVV